MRDRHPAKLRLNPPRDSSEFPTELRWTPRLFLDHASSVVTDIFPGRPGPAPQGLKTDSRAVRETSFIPALEDV